MNSNHHICVPEALKTLKILFWARKKTILSSNFAIFETSAPGFSSMDSHYWMDESRCWRLQSERCTVRIRVNIVDWELTLEASAEGCVPTMLRPLHAGQTYLHEGTRDSTSGVGGVPTGLEP